MSVLQSASGHTDSKFTGKKKNSIYQSIEVIRHLLLEKLMIAMRSKCLTFIIHVRFAKIFHSTIPPHNQRDSTWSSLSRLPPILSAVFDPGSSSRGGSALAFTKCEHVRTQINYCKTHQLATCSDPGNQFSNYM